MYTEFRGGETDGSKCLEKVLDSLINKEQTTLISRVKAGHHCMYGIESHSSSDSSAEVMGLAERCSRAGGSTLCCARYADN